MVETLKQQPSLKWLHRLMHLRRQNISVLNQLKKIIFLFTVAYTFPYLFFHLSIQPSETLKFGNYFRKKTALRFNHCTIDWYILNPL